MFSEESLLLIENWETVEDMLQAAEGLREELFAIIHSVEDDLRQTDWWHDGWTFARSGKTQVYISNEAWRQDDDYAVWIGIEGFSPEGIFGSGPSPNLYVWVSGERYELARGLGQTIESAETAVMGELDQRPTSGYVVRQFVRKCLPEEVDSYPGVVRGQVLSFFGHYAAALSDLSDVIREALARQE